MSEAPPSQPGLAAQPTPVPPQEPASEALAVLANRPFLLLWLSQAATQIGGNIVLYGLSILVVQTTSSPAAVSVLLLTFLVPAVLFSAWAGVFVDRFDRRTILVVTNVLRAVAFVALYFTTDNLLAVYALNIFISTVTVFFAPAEAAMIPHLVPRNQLMTANGIFIFTLNASFAIGFALLGPLIVKIAGTDAVIAVVAGLYLLAAAFCFTLPSSRSRDASAVSATEAVMGAEHAVGSVLGQLREGLGYIRAHPEAYWSLLYLGITASLIGVLGVLGPDYAQEALGLAPEDFVIIVLPLGFGLVSGVLVLNKVRTIIPRRRLIEGGLISFGILLAALSAAGPLSRLLQHAADPTEGIVDLSGLTSLLSLVVAIAFLAGLAYGFVAVPSQTQLQEDIPEDVRGRVFGVLNMLVSVASFVPIILVGAISEVASTTQIILAVAILTTVTGVVSVLVRGPSPRTALGSVGDGHIEAMDPLAVALHADPRYEDDAATITPEAGKNQEGSS